MSSDEDIQRAQTGDVQAFTRLVRLHDEKLRRFVYTIINNPSDIDDVMQDTYLKAYKSLRSYRAESSFAVWLHRIANNTMIDHARKHARLIPTPDEHLKLAPTAAASAQRVDILTALRALPEKQRAIALLVDGHGYDYASVAAIVQIPVGTVAYQLHRARKTLRSHLQSKEAQ